MSQSESKRINAIPKRLKKEPVTDIHWNTRMLPRETQNEYQPRTALGKKLMALRRAYIANGGQLLDETGIEAELRARRGGVNA